MIWLSAHLGFTQSMPCDMLGFVTPPVPASLQLILELTGTLFTDHLVGWHDGCSLGLVQWLGKDEKVGYLILNPGPLVLQSVV